MSQKSRTSIIFSFVQSLIVLWPLIICCGHIVISTSHLPTINNLSAFIFIDTVCQNGGGACYIPECYFSEDRLWIVRNLHYSFLSIDYLNFTVLIPFPPSSDTVSDGCDVWLQLMTNFLKKLSVYDRYIIT